MEILIVDDQPDNLRTMMRIAESCGYSVVTALNGKQAKKAISERLFHIIVLDVRLPDIDGISLLQEIKAMDDFRHSDCILVTGYGDVDMAVRSFRNGAYDFITKPVEIDDFASVLNRAAEHQELLRSNLDYKEHFAEKLHDATQKLQDDFTRARECLRKLSGIGEVIANSAGMKEAMEMALRCHENPEIPVLIEGETGTGKELISKIIHYGDCGVDLPLVDLSCSAIPRDLFESELFGYDAGTFTGGRERGKIGKFEFAGTGTLLLDDISDMPLEFQPKVLRVLQERVFYRIGGAEKVSFNARVVSTSNQSLEKMAEDGRFRRDLLHRICFAHIEIPPLRERREDIIDLAEYFLKTEALRQKRKPLTLTELAKDRLQNYNWPGNVRELQGAMCRVVLCCKSEEINADSFSFLKGCDSASDTFSKEGLFTAIHRNWLRDGRTLDDLNNELVQSALEQFDGNQSQAARHLGVTRYALRRRLK